MIFSIQYLSYIYLQPIEIFLPIDVTFAKRTPAPIGELHTKKIDVHVLNAQTRELILSPLIYKKIKINGNLLFTKSKYQQK